MLGRDEVHFGGDLRQFSGPAQTHRGGADHCCTDEDRLGGCFKCVTRSVVGLQVVLRLFKIGREAKILLDFSCYLFLIFFD